MSLTNRAVTGAAWTVASSLGGRVLGLLSNLLLATLLTPAEYGEANVAVVLVFTVQTFTNFGFGQYLIASSERDDATAFHATVYHVLSGWGALALLTVFGGALGRFFNATAGGPLIAVMAMGMAIDRVAFVPTRILAREMRFGLLGLRQLVGELTYATLSLWLAYAGYGAMAIVLANVGRALLGLVLVVMGVAPHKWLSPRRLQLAVTRKLLGFGLPLTVGGVLYFASSKWDRLVMAKLFDSRVLGQYNFAYNIADIPAIQLGEQITDVLMPTFARLSPGEDRQYALAKGAGILAFVVFPVAVGLGAIAQTLARAFLSAEWSLVGGMLLLLSALSVVRPLGWLISAYLQVMQRPRTVMYLEAIKAMSVVGLIAVLGRLGPYWACVGVGAGFALHTLLSALRVCRVDGMQLAELFGPMVRPLLACLPIVLGVWLVRLGLGGHLSPRQLLPCELLAGVSGYGVGTVWLARRQAKDVLRLLRNAWAARHHAEEA